MARIDIMEDKGGKIIINCDNENVISVEGQTLYVHNGKAEIEEYVNQTAKAELDMYALEVIKPYTDAAQQTVENVYVQAIGTDLASGNSSLQRIAENMESITTAAGVSADIRNVAEHIADVSAVNLNMEAVNTVATNITDINTAAGVSADISSVAEHIADVSAVNLNMEAVNTVATNITDINTAADVSADIRNVAEHIADVSAVNLNMEAVNTVATNITDINTAAGVSADISSVAEHIADVSAVNLNMEAVNTVATNITDISEVAGSSQEIATIEDNLAAVQSVGTNIISVCDVAQNMSSVQSAVVWAEGSDEAVAEYGGTHSAKGWAEIASQADIGDATETTAGIARVATSAEAMAGTLNNVMITPKTLAEALPKVQKDIVLSEATSGDITLQAGNIYSMQINGDTTYILPQVTENVESQIKVYITIAGTPEIAWGTDMFVNQQDIKIAEGNYEVIYNYHKQAEEWIANIIPIRKVIKIVDSFKFTVNSGDDASFILPTCSAYGTGNSYNWVVDWGDGTVTTETGTGNAMEGSGITHSYPQANTNYQIALQTSEDVDRWGQCFGFNSGSTGANETSNKEKILSLDTSFTDKMFADADGTVGSSCFTNMFVLCPSLTMGEGFNLPQNISGSVDGFCNMMFGGCTSLQMNDIFNLPPNITSAGSAFCAYMFMQCGNLSMNSVFNLPPNITTASSSFCMCMFDSCSSLQMNSVFNLPQNLTSVGSSCFEDMFSRCSNMNVNAVFQMPANIVTKGSSYGKAMFYNCSSLTSIGFLNNTPVVEEQMFYGCTSLNRISLSDYVTEIKSNAFAYCSTLDTVVIGNQISSIDSTAFVGCPSMTSIMIHRKAGSVSGSPWGALTAEIMWSNIGDEAGPGDML